MRKRPELFTCEPYGPGPAVVVSPSSPGDSNDATYHARTRRHTAAGRTALGRLPLAAWAGGSRQAERAVARGPEAPRWAVRPPNKAKTTPSQFKCETLRRIKLLRPANASVQALEKKGAPTGTGVASSEVCRR